MKPKRMKAFRAWAVIDIDDALVENAHTSSDIKGPFAIYQTRADAVLDADLVGYGFGERIIRVLITEIPPKKRAKKGKR